MFSNWPIRLALVAATALAVAGCGSTCNSSNCGGCCSATGVCETPSTQTCGLGGAACTACGVLDSCQAGVCQFQGNGAGTNGPATSAASTTGNTQSNTTSSGQAATTGVTNGNPGSSSTSRGTSGRSSNGNTLASIGTSGSPTMGTSSGSGPTSTTSSSSGTGTTGTSATSSSGTTGGLPICSTCSLNAQCASGFCNTATSAGFCDTAMACNPAGGDAQVSCTPYQCGANGDCICPTGTTASTSTTGSTGTTSTTGGLNPCCAQDPNLLTDCGIGSPFCIETCCDPITCCGFADGGTLGGLIGTAASTLGTGTSGTGSTGGTGTTGACPDVPIAITGPGSSVNESGNTANGADTLNSGCNPLGALGQGTNLEGYTFTLTETADVFAVAGSAGGTLDPIISLGTGCSNGSYTEQYCNANPDGPTTFFGVENLAPGTYELLVSGTQTTGPYTLHVWAESQQSAPANDVCSGAINLPLSTFSDGGLGGTVAVNNFWADNTTESSLSGQCAGSGFGPNLVYAINLTAAATGITATLIAGEDGGLNEGVVSIQESPCEENADGGQDLTSELACGDWQISTNAVANYTGNVRAGTYYIWVDQYGGGVPGEGTLTVTVP